jgi:hypothetical protein
MSNKMSKEQLVALQEEIDKMGGREKYIVSELKRRGIKIEPKMSLIKLVQQEMINAQRLFPGSDADAQKQQRKHVVARKEEYIENRQKEEEVRAELRSTTWAAYKATHISHLGDGIYWNDVLERDFYDAYKNEQENEDRRVDNDLPQLDTVEDIIEAFKEVVPDMDVPKLRWFCYNRDVAEVTHYRTFAIPKKSGGKRYISAPMPQMKALQEWILRNILVRMPVHEAAHGFVHGRSIVTNAQAHTNSEFVLSMDLKDFFPTLTFRRVKGIFRAMGYLEGVSTILALICTEAPRQAMKINDPQTGDEKWVHVAVGPRCLPQGSPASPMLTNLAALRLDRRLTGFAQKHGLRFTRYADDLTVSAPKGETHKASWIQKVVTQVVENEGYNVHPTKTKLMGGGDRQEVTGLVVNDDLGVRVPAEVKDMLRAAIHNQEQGKALYENESFNTLLGYASFVYSAQPEKGRSSIERLLALLDNISE